MSELDIKSIELYLPEYCVQGERIPFYLLWDKSKNLKISMNLPQGLTVSEVYNVDSKDIKLENGNLYVTKFEVSGYFGGVISSKLYNEASTTKTVKFTIDEGTNGNQTYQKSIELFRPDVKISNTISDIKIKIGKDNRPFSDVQIPLYNYGKGTGIVKIQILENSEVKESIPEGFEEFKLKFVKDMNDGLTIIKINFPQYAELIESFKIMLKDPLPSEEDKLKKIRITAEKLVQAFNNSEDFFSEICECVATSYLKNVSIMTDIVAFIAFMRSVGKNKIIFLDAMKVLKISSTAKKLSAELIITDLVQNKYPAIKLPSVSITADKDCVIPIYQILNASLVS